MREQALAALKDARAFDVLVIGGGATGCGIALDAASRGLSVALVEKGDFAEGTSGRSTKLVHGGVRYLEQAVLKLDRSQFGLVRDALRERSVLLKIAPHLVHPLRLATPLYRWWQVPYVYAGLKLYDLLAGRRSLGASRLLGRRELLARYPFVRRKGLKAGIEYSDGQFNDVRMAVSLFLTALASGAAAANHVEAVDFLKESGRVVGALVRDRLGGDSWPIRARATVNATGPFGDCLRRLDDPAAPPLLRVSSGAHLVLGPRVPPPEGGITIPKTEDGRLLFVLPWQGRCLVGTTDDPARPDEHPHVHGHDVAYLLRHLDRYFDLRVERADIRSSWAGLRPLVADPMAHDTARLSRDHVISMSESGLVTVAGGKWTTYRKMAQDTVDFLERRLGLSPPTPCRTEELLLVGADAYHPEADGDLAARFRLDPEVARHLLGSYGDRAEAVAVLASGELAERLSEGFPYLKAEVVYAARNEHACTASDVLCRRVPLALLDRGAARSVAEWVLATLAGELRWDGRRLSDERAELAARLNQDL